jgi:acyl carrier protein
MSATDMTKDEISAFCVDRLVEILQIPKHKIDAHAKFSRLGLDSAMTVYLLMELEDRLGVEISQDTFYDYPTVDALSVHLADTLAERSGRHAVKR